MPGPISTPTRNGVHIDVRESGIAASFKRRSNAELGMAIHPPGLLLAEDCVRVEALDFAGESGLIVGRVETGDRRDAGLTGHDRCPALGSRIADRAERARIP